MASGRRCHGEFHEKTFKEAWLNDVGAYPVMAIIAGTVIGVSIVCSCFVATDKDARLVKEKRTNPFRGEFAKVAFTQDLDELARQKKAAKVIAEVEEEEEVEEESA